MLRVVLTSVVDPSKYISVSNIIRRIRMALSLVVVVVSHRHPRQVFQSPILSHIGSGQAFTVKEVKYLASD